MTERHDKTPEQPKTLADWRSNFKLALLGALAINAGIVGLLDLDWQQEAAPLAESQRTHDDANDLINQVERVNEITATLEAEKSARIDEAIDTYLDRDAAGYVGGVAPIRVYLELTAYDKVLFELKHLAARSSPGSLGDYQKEIEELTEGWQKIYDEKLQDLLEKDLPWTGDPVQDFPQLRRLSYEGGQAFFSPQEGIEPFYAAYEHSPLVQLQTGQLDCTSSRFTHWLLEAIYKDRGLDTTPLQNLKAIAWEDHVSSFQKQGVGGTQLKEMANSEKSVQAGVLSAVNGKPGRVLPQGRHLAYELYQNHSCSLAQEDRLLHLGLLDDTNVGSYAEGEPPPWALLRDKKETSDAAAEKITADLLKQNKNRLSRALNLFGMESIPDAAVVEIPPAIANASMRDWVKKSIISGNDNLRSTVLFSDQFQALCAYAPSEAGELFQHLTAGKTRKEVWNELAWSEQSDRQFALPIPLTVFQWLSEDEETAKEIDALADKSIEDVKNNGAADPSKGFRHWTWEYKTIKRWKVLRDPSWSDDSYRQAILKRSKETWARGINEFLPGPDLGEEDLTVSLTSADSKVNLDGYFAKVSDAELVTAVGAASGYASWLEVYKALRINNRKLEPADLSYVQTRVVTTTKPSQAQEEPYRAAVLEALVALEASGQINGWDRLYLGWDELLPFEGEKARGKVLQVDTKATRPSKEFIEYIQEGYITGGNMLRQALLMNFSNDSIMFLKPGMLDADTLNWIHRQSDEAGLRLRFYYDDDFDPKTLTDAQLLHLLVGEPYNMKVSEQSYDRLAELWTEMERRHLITP